MYRRKRLRESKLWAERIELSCPPVLCRSINAFSPYNQPSFSHPSCPDFVSLYLLNCVLRSSTKMFSRVAARHSSYTAFYTPRSIRASSFRQLPKLGQRASRQYATKPAEAVKKTSDLPW